MPYRAYRLSSRRPLQPLCEHWLFAVVGLSLSQLIACGESSKSPGNESTGSVGGAGGNSAETGGNSADAGSGGATATYNVGEGIGGSGFNQCGVAAPMPADPGQCTAVTVPLIANFDDYAGTAPESYKYYINANTSTAVQGTILHIGDGSNTDDAGASIISTEMVTGEGGAGYALQIADTNATHWGGLLMLFFPNAGVCVDASAYGGIQFSIKGTSPSGNFGVNVGMRDTIPTSDNGLCTNATASDCKDANLQLPLPADGTTWKNVKIPWNAFTPGIGSGVSCVPLTGQNIVRIVIQPFMNYPPPNYTYQAGPYQIAVDNLQFY